MSSYNAEELAQALFEESGDALFVFDPDTEQIHDANPTAQRLSGYTRGEMLRLKAGYLFRSESAGGLQRLRQAYRKTGIFHSQEGFLLRNKQDGVWVPVNLTITRLHVQPKTLALVTARDISDQRAAHQQLKKMETELRRVLASISDCLWTADIDPAGQWVYRYLSPVVEKITGRPGEYFLLAGLPAWEQLVHADDRPRWESALARYRSGESQQVEYRLLHADGGERWVRESVMVARAQDGRFLKLDGVLTDITGRKDAEQKLRASEERLTRIVETDADGIIIVNRDGRITFANASAERILGLPRSEIMRRTYNDPAWKITTASGKSVPEEDLPFSRVMKAGRPVYGIEHAIRRSDRSWVLVSVNAAPLQDGAGAIIGMVSSFSDITDRKRAELAVQRRSEEQEAVLRVSQFLLPIESERRLYLELPDLLSAQFSFEVVLLKGHESGAAALSVLGQTGLPPRGPQWERIPREQSISQTVIESGQALVVTDLAQRPEFRTPLMQRLRIQTLVCLPLTAGSRVIGTLLLASPQAKLLSPSLPATLQTIADLAAQTIERKRAEAALRETNDRLQTLIEAAPLAIFTLEPDGRVRSWNRSAERIFGWSEAEVLGQPPPMIPADQQATVRALRQRVLRGESFTEIEARRQRKDGTVIDVNLSAAPLHDAGGRVQGIMALAADITERKRAEEAVRQSEERFRALVEKSSDAVALLDAAGIIRYSSPSTSRIVGFAAEELVGRPIFDLCHPDELSFCAQKFAECLARPGQDILIECRGRHKDGGWRFIEGIGNNRLSDPSVQAIIFNYRDITERKRAAEALEREQHLLHALMENVPDSIYFKDQDSRFIRVNRAVLKKLELADAGPVLGKSDSYLFETEFARQARADEERVMRTGQPIVSREEKEVWPDGRETWALTTTMPLRDPEGRIMGTFGISRDITERKRFEAELARERDLLRTLMENIPDLIYFKDTALRFTRVNICHARYLGLADPDQAVGKTDFDFYPAEFAQAFCEDERRIFESGQPVINKVERQFGADGAERWILTTKVPIFDRDGRPAGLVGVSKDITEYKRAEEELQEREWRLQAILNSEPECVKVVALDGTLLEMNPAGLAMVEAKTAQEVRGRPVWSLIHEADRAAFQALHGRVCGGQQGSLQFRIVGLRGTVRWMETNSVPLRSHEGDISAVLSVTRDITDHKQAEEALRASERRYRLLFERNLAGVFRATATGDIVDCNDSFARILGHDSRAEVLAHQSTDYYFQPTDRDSLIGRLRHNHALANFENCLRRKDGKPVWILENVSLLQGDNGEEFLEGTIFDITERKLAEEALDQERALLRGLIDSIPELIFYKNRDGVYLGCNRAFEKFAGKREADVIDRSDQELFPEEVASSYQVRDRQVLAEGKPRRNEEWLTYPDGRRLLVETLKTPFFGPDGRILGLIGITRDITERKRLEEQLRQSQKMEAIGQLAGGVAHDFNNLLTAILGNVSLLLGAVPTGDPNREQLLATEKAALRAAELTRQLLGFSRQTMLRLEPTNLNHAIQETLGILGRTIDPRIKVEVRWVADLWTVLADAGQVNQVLLNLCLNARDAMPDGGRLHLATENVTLAESDAQLHLDARPGEFVRLRVSDTGHGIAPEIKSRIFDPFFTTKGPGKGTGLGLAMVFGIVKQHDGWIECHSEVGYGTRFDIFLPRSKQAAVTPAPLGGTAPVPGGGNETILLVDDEAIIRNLGRTILQRQGYEVLLAEDGRQAVELFKKEKDRIDLVILDLTMPHMSGRDALVHLRQIDPNVRVVFASGYSAEHVTEFVQDEVLGFISKPYRPQDLANAVRGVLDKIKAGVGESANGGT